MYRYYLLLTDKSVEEIEQIKKMHPRQAKEDLARIIVSDFHSPEEADQAAAEFRKVFTEKQMPDEVETFSVAAGTYPVLQLLKESGLVTSNSDARRLIRQGAISLRENENEPSKLTDETQKLTFPSGKTYILKVGPKRFKKLEVL
jgi:tyrosyl-tRNA synthetase